MLELCVPHCELKIKSKDFWLFVPKIILLLIWFRWTFFFFNFQNKLRNVLSGLETRKKGSYPIPFSPTPAHSPLQWDYINSWFDQPRIQSLMRCEVDTQGKKRWPISGWLLVAPDFLGGHTAVGNTVDTHTQAPTNSCCCADLKPELTSPFQNRLLEQLCLSI